MIYKETKPKKKMRHWYNAGLAFFSLSLAGCGLYTPTAVVEQPYELHRDVVTHDVSLSDVDDAFVAGLANHYRKHGDSTLDLILTYDPKSSRNTAMNATNSVSEVVQALRDNGVDNVNPSIMPIHAQGDDSRLVISYDSVIAKAPEECNTKLSGTYNDRDAEKNQYKLGCSIKTMVARQISRPSDLAGRGLSGAPSDARGASNIVDIYRSGAPNEPLTGESASE